MELNQISSQIIKAAINVHKELGPGLLESVYQKCMAIELPNMDLNVETEVEIPVVYCGKKITDFGFRIDLFVESTVIVELKSVEVIKAVHKKAAPYLLKIDRETAWPADKFQRSNAQEWNNKDHQHTTRINNISHGDADLAELIFY